MATFQLFFQSGRAKDLSAPLYIASTCFSILSHHLQGAETNISLKHTAIKWAATISVCMVWYQWCTILLVLVKIIYINII